MLENLIFTLLECGFNDICVCTIDPIVVVKEYSLTYPVESLQLNCLSCAALILYDIWYTIEQIIIFFSAKQGRLSAFFLGSLDMIRYRKCWLCPRVRQDIDRQFKAAFLLFIELAGHPCSQFRLTSSTQFTASLTKML